MDCIKQGLCEFEVKGTLTQDEVDYFESKGYTVIQDEKTNLHKISWD